MKTLIINGSPRKNGDTNFFINHLVSNLKGSFEIINCYYDKISPCNDCRHCWKHKGCSIKDDMEKIYKDDYDNVVIATPVYCSGVTPPLFSLITRLNYLWSNKHFLNIDNTFKKKTGILILVGGGNGEPDYALKLIESTFRKLNADYKDNQVLSLSTNTLPANLDTPAQSKLEQIIQKINNLNK